MIYDIIGDIHGHADELTLLLAKLGYHKKGGTYSQAGHQSIFVGDFIDRGPKIRETLTIVRKMVDKGTARAVMGNHEFNAICYHTRDGRGFLRSHTAKKGKNRKQHQETIKQMVKPHSKEWRGYLEWFKCLPFFLELDGLRVVHAAWDRDFVEFVRTRSLRDDAFLRRSAKKRHKEFDAIEMLLKGPEIPLPAGFRDHDKEGIDRREMRVAWWKPRTLGKHYTYDELSIPGATKMPKRRVRRKDLAHCPSYGSREPLVFFGHYWLRAEAPKPLAPNAACVDFSVAKDGGRLVAYTWRGERTLKPEHFVSVPRISRAPGKRGC